MAEKGESSKPPMGRGRGRAVRVVPAPGTETETAVVGRASSQIGRRSEVRPPEYSEKGKGRESPADVSPDHEKFAALDLISLAQRPGFGSLGRKYRVVANHFELRFKQKILQVYHYHIEIRASMKLTRDENRPIFWQVVANHAQLLGLTEQTKSMFQIAYDGVSGCYSLHKFNINTPTEVEVEILLPRRDRMMKFQVLIQPVGPVMVDLSSIVGFAAGTALTPVQVLDIILRQYRSNPNLPESGSFYPFKSSVFMIPGAPNAPGGLDLGGGREIWKGLFTSVHATGHGRAFVNIDVDHSVFYKHRLPGLNGGVSREYSVINFLCDVLNAHQGRNMYLVESITATSTLGDIERRVFDREIKGLKVCVGYREKSPRNNPDRQWRVIGVDDPASRIFFIKQDGTKLSVAQHFEQTYGNLKAPNMPTLKVGQKNRFIHLPIEHCYLAKNQKFTKKLADNQVATMIKQTCMAPHDRQRSIGQMVALARFGEDPYLEAFGVHLDTNMVRLDSRVLPAPTILYKNDTSVNVRDGVWRMQPNYKFHLPGSIQNMAALSFGQPPRNAMNFLDGLLRTCEQYGMTVPKVDQVFSYAEVDTSSKRVDNAFDVLQQKLAQHKIQCQLVLIFVPRKGLPLYAEVKRLAEIKLGFMTQCVTFKTIERCDRDSMANLSFKINMKVGGVNCYLKSQEQAYQRLFYVPTMTLGIDVTHPGPTESRMCSIASVVGSMDKMQMRYGVSIKVQKQRKEQIVYVSELATERLIAYYREMKIRPERIIVYRDGISEGEFREIIREELRGVREACTKVDVTFKPKITFIVVQKRHHTRLFPEVPDDSCGKSRNVHPGTIVDHTILHDDSYSFYLCSHAGIQGTSRPTRYIVLHDDNDFKPDDIQLITYYLCHCFSRCTRSVSIPAPIYYADLACTRSRQHVNAAIGDSLSDTASTSSGDFKITTFTDQEYIDATTITESLNKEMYFT